jgi:hypothetical protein
MEALDWASDWAQQAGVQGGQLFEKGEGANKIVKQI